MNKTLEYLIDALKSLPGVGIKQAKSIAQHLIKKDDEYIDEFISRIKKAKNDIKFCSQCNNISENELCDICKDFNRDATKLCIVTTSDDLTKIDSTGEYKGLYYVLNDEFDGKKNKELSSKIVTKFIKLLNLYKFNEIIIATNWTNNGELTAVFLKKIILNYLPNAVIYRLAVGLPINSALDYADNATLKHALKNKTNY